MIPRDIRDLIIKQPGRVLRSTTELDLVLRSLNDLNISEQSELGEFFLEYCLSGVLSNRRMELLDLCSPTLQIWNATRFGRDVYDVPDEYVCLTSGESEGFVLYSVTNRRIYDIGVSEIEALENGLVQPTWSTFFELMRWYLQ